MLNPSRLTLATSAYWFPTLPPGSTIGAAPTCPEAVTKNVNVLRDPSFDNGLVIAPEYSPSSTVILGTTFGVPNASGTLSDHDTVGYYMDNDLASINPEWFSISTANPRTGTSHARWTDPGGSASQDPYITAVGLESCQTPLSASWEHHLVSCRIDAGDTITFTAYVEDTSVSVSSTLWSMQVVYKSGTGSVSGLIDTGYGSQSSYTQITGTGTAPTGAQYALCSVIVEADEASTGETFDIDDVSVVVT